MGEPGNTPLTENKNAISEVDQLRSCIDSQCTQSLQKLETECGQTCRDAVKNRTDVQTICEQHQHHFLQYCSIGKVTDNAGQMARNNVREKLLHLVHLVEPKLKQLAAYPHNTAAAITSARAEQLERIDAMVSSLQQMRQTTVDMFEQLSENVDIDNKASASSLQSLVRELEPMDKFMACYTQEVQEEKAEADRFHEEWLQKLHGQERRYEGCGASFKTSELAKAREEMKACKRLMDDQTNKADANAALKQKWDSAYKAVSPRKRAAEPEPAEEGPSFFKRLRCAGRAAPSA